MNRVRFLTADEQLLTLSEKGLSQVCRRVEIA